MKKKYFLNLLLLLGLISSQAIWGQEYTSVALNGFNADVIANGTGSAINTTNSDVDGVNYAFKSLDWKNNANSAAQTKGLPVDGIIHSLATTGVSYQLEPYSDNNSIRLGGTGATAVTEITSEVLDDVSAVRLFLLLTSGSGISKLTGVVTFKDDTTQDFVIETVQDWYGTTPLPIAARDFGRVNKNNGAADDGTPTNQPLLFQATVDIAAANQLKEIKSITFTRDVSSKGIINIFGVSAEIIPDCPKPTNLVVGNITSNSAIVTWDNTGNSYEFDYGVSGFIPGTGTEEELMVATKTLSNLIEGQVYDVYVRKDCDIDGLSNWTGPISFMASDILTYSGGIINTNKVDWDVSASTVSQCPGTLTLVVPDGKRIASLNVEYNMTAAQNAWKSEQRSYIYSPTLNMGEGSLASGTGTGGTQSYNRDLAFAKEAMGTIVFELHAFRTYGGNGCSTDYNFVENNSWKLIAVFEDIPTCLDVKGVVISDVTSNSVTISWEAPTSNVEIGYTYEVRESGLAGSGDEGLVLTGTTLTDVTSVDLDGLDSSSIYYVYVRANCTNIDVSYWSSSVSFMTPCSPKSIPFLEGFELNYSNNGEVDGCWTQASINGDQKWIANNTETSFNREPRTGNWNATLRYGNEDWMFMPVQLEEGVNYRLRFYARQDGGNANNASVKASLGLAGTVDAMNIPVIPEKGLVGGNYQKVEGVFQIETSGVYYLGINGKLNSSPWHISIDDISLEVAPDCIPPTQPVIAAGLESATASWTASLSNFVDTYEWEVRTNGAPGTDGAVTTGSVAGDLLTATITGLTSGTSYTLYLRSTCGAGEVSEWTEGLSFKTHIATPSPWHEGFASTVVPNEWNTSGWTINNTGDLNPGEGNYIYKNLYGTGVNATGSFTTITVGPILEGDIFSMTHRIVNFNGGNLPGANSGDFKVEFSTDFGDTYVLMDTVLNGDMIAGWQEYSYDMEDYEGEYVKIRITATREDGDYYMAFDEFDISNPANCNAPFGLKVTDIMASTAVISWNKTNSINATGYTYEIRTSGEAGSGTVGLVLSETLNDVNDLTANLQNLSPGETYYVYIKANCGTASSAWSTGVTFKYDYCMPTFKPSNCGGYRLYDVLIGDIANYVEDEDCKTWDYTSQITGHALGEEVEFSIRLGAWMSFAIYVDFNKDGDFDDEGEMVYAGHPLWETSVETKTDVFTIPLEVAEGKYRMRVVGVWGDGQPNYSEIGVGQACDYFDRPGSGNFHDYTLYVGNTDCEIEVTSSSVSDITGKTATLNWVSTGTNFDIEYGEKGFVQGDGTLVTGVTSPHVLEGLDFETEYDYYVRAVCEFSEGDWTVVKTFTTLEPLSQVITANDVSKVYGAAPFVHGSSDSDLPLTYEVADNTVAKVVAGELVLVGAGETEVTAKQSGDALYEAAEDVVFTLTVEKAPLVIKATDVEKIYDGAAYAVADFTVEYDAFVYNEDASVLTGTLVFGGTAANNATNVGSYTIEVSGLSALNYDITFEEGTLDIVKAPILGITFEGQTVIYDGTDKSIFITGELPLGATITYENNGHTEIGDYTVIAKILGGADYADLTLEAVMRVRADLSNLSFEDASFVYDGTAKSLSLTGILPEGASVDYVGNEQTEVGVYVVTANIDGGADYGDLTLEATLTITKATLEGIAFEDGTFTYDSTVKSLAIDGELPIGVTVSYSENDKINAGVYDVTAVISGGNNYEDLSLEAVLTIEKALIDDVTLVDATFLYDTTSKSLTVTGSVPDGVTVTYLGNAQTDVGVYEVEASLDGGNNYESLVLVATMTINKGIITGVTLEDALYGYDGTSKSLTIEGTLPAGTSVSYVNNNHTAIGVYEVTATIAGGSNYNDLVLNATLTIAKGAINGVYLKDATFVYDGSVHSLAVTGTLPAGVTVVYENNDQTNVGIYTVKATLVGGTHYETIVLSAKLIITKKPIEGLVFADGTFVYDGTVKSLAIGGVLPEGATVTYENNDQILGGIYSVVARVNGGANYSGQELKAKLTIEKARQTITFDALDVVVLEDSQDFQLEASASSGLPVTYTYTSSTGAATVSESGWVSLIHEGTVVITAHQEGDRNYLPANTVAQSLIIESREITMDGLWINDTYFEEPAQELYYMMDCEALTGEVTFQVEVGYGIKVTPGLSFTLSVPEPGIYSQTIQLTSSNGNLVKEYVITVEKPFEFSRIASQKFDNTLIINNNPKTNGGYHFVGYEWFKNGESIGKEQVYSAGDSSQDLLEVGASYHAILMTDKGEELHVCPLVVERKGTFGVRLYPSPAQVGSTVTLQVNQSAGDFERGSMDIYNMKGQHILSQELSSALTEFELPHTIQSGVYIAVLRINNKQEVIRFIVE